MYEHGDEGVIVDHGKAISWYKRGAAEQDLMACFSLGRLALDETSPEYDPALGLYWLQWAAMKGQVLATERLADFYLSTFDVPPGRAACCIASGGIWPLPGEDRRQGRWRPRTGSFNASAGAHKIVAIRWAKEAVRAGYLPD